MILSELLFGAEVASVSGGDTVISGLQYDSRRVNAGDCFIAMKGGTTDGNQHIDSAIAAGAIAVVTDSVEQQPRAVSGWASIKPGHGRRALGQMSANLYGHPSSRLGLIGVTGTNGKTTTTYLIESILAAAEKKSALIGTIEYRIAGTVVPAPHTTPESLELNKFFADAVKEGVTEGVMEVSSHALEQERVFGVPFDVAVFTNLTRDHLDYHRDMENYYAAKQVLFAGCGAEPPRVSVINQDDSYGQKLIDFSKLRGSQLITYGFEKADFRPVSPEVSPKGTRFEMVTPDGNIAINSQLVGRVNVYNILAAAAATHSRGVSLEHIAEGVAALSHVPGRFQRVSLGQPFTVVVDYAHTDDALRNLTTLARELVSIGKKKSRVITLFGCGGDRDRAKRPMMAEAAGKGSDFVILTSDNPRSEDPLRIIHDALLGLRKLRSAEFTVEPDRKRAISLALRLAKAGDIVLIAGKGHEKVQITKEGSQPFDDVEVARKALQAAGYAEGFGEALSGSVGV
ncbi:MAG: UDP-N-acetylmuramoylalanyl-D-glutamate--2,6-diaminopimelate ligase [Acidobacteriaceae bacterium]|nr:UDP-N-acetylmuramoylalanyl-D-glutamate--2,6-diaminopimelate ligase [Acidobacteriaceae bacterium]